MSKYTSILSTYSGVRPNNTTAYAAGDVMSDISVQQCRFSNFGIADSSIWIQSACLSLNTGTKPSENGFSGFRLYLYNNALPVGIPDNFSWFLFDSGQGIDDINKYRGYIDFIPYVSTGNFLYFQNNNVNKQIKLSPSSVYSLYGHLVTLGTYSNPQPSTTFTIELNGIQL
jgi:hypothetical protein